MSVIILGIESSCDETSASVVKDGYVISNYIANQTIHQNMVELYRAGFKSTSAEYYSSC